MKRIRLLGVVAAAAAIAALAGCGQGERAAQPQTPSPDTPSVTRQIPPTTTTATTTARPGTIRTPSPAKPAKPVLTDGRYCVWLTGLNRGARTLGFDVVQWLTGDEADAAFHRDHPEAPDVGVPNGYYILNQNPRLRTLSVAPHAMVRVLVPIGSGTQLQSITFEKLPAVLAHDLEPHDKKLWFNPFWLTVRHGRVVAVVEQYIP